eukprot:TRINITY_DN3660_c0_g1_i1.p1 TRINITY_DN3660_c0_g1~~TRINITY_DN3660_c0_g1_i1.p1  ORF type:complete len:236 (-),score=76.36 TRINITY_DN3660_c0_g1_i1:151-858(-)
MCIRDRYQRRVRDTCTMSRAIFVLLLCAAAITAFPMPGEMDNSRYQPASPQELGGSDEMSSGKGGKGFRGSNDDPYGSVGGKGNDKSMGKGGSFSMSAIMAEMKKARIGKGQKGPASSKEAANGKGQLGEDAHAKSFLAQRAAAMQSALERIKKINGKGNIKSAIMKQMSGEDRRHAAHDELFGMMTGHYQETLDDSKMQGLSPKEQQQVSEMSLANNLGWDDKAASDGAVGNFN